MSADILCKTAVAAAILAGGVMTTQAGAASSVDIPYLEGIKINAQAADWGDRGFRVETMGLRQGDWHGSAEGFAPSIRVGWNKDGILALAKVIDNFVAESEDISTLYLKDSVEIWAGTRGAEMSTYQVAIATGADPKYPEARKFFWDRRAKSASLPELSIQHATAKIPGGYIVEALLPWKNLGVTPKKGMEVGFMIVVNDSDRDTRSYDDAVHALWSPAGVADWSTGMWSVRLSDSASAPVLAAGDGKYEYCKRAAIRVRASVDLIGDKLSVKSGRKTLAESTVVKGEDGWGRVNFSLPMPEKGKPYEGLKLATAQGAVGVVQMNGDSDYMRAQTIMDANLRFTPCVFEGSTFPSCDFQQPLLAEAAIGEYDIKCTFYDNDYNVVKTAEKPGRYGAIVKVTPRNGGKVITRCQTLFREEKPTDWWSYPMKMTVDFPKNLGIDQAVLQEQSGTVGDMMKWSFLDSMYMNQSAATVLAGLYETKPGDGASADAWTRDRQWWVTLKRKLYGFDKKYPAALVAPRTVSDGFGTVIHEGSLAEAGMKPEVMEKLDKYFQTWAADSDEAFAVCIVRHGVVAIHKAYGMRDGAPMTVDTPSWMASNTKTLSANLMWMLMDQDMVKLDDLAGKYLPPLADVKVTRPLTVRNLYNHTNGFSGDHWGDGMADLEDVISDYYPYLKVQQAQRYSGVGCAMGGRIVELLTGECIPTAYKNHLIGPLGMTHTEVTGTYGDARSVPMDMAKVSQLMLNGGTYGDKQFYRKETFAKMLPVDLNQYIPADSPTTTPDRMWGIGLMAYPSEGFGKGTFGHGAASGATLRIDPENDMIVIMTRNSTGSNYDKYYPDFIKTVLEAIQK